MRTHQGFVLLPADILVTINRGVLTAFFIPHAPPAVGVYFLLRRNMNTGFAGVGVKG